MEYSLFMLALACSLVLIPENAQAAEANSSPEKKVSWISMLDSKKDPKRKKAKKHEKDEKPTGSLSAIKGDELRERLAQMKAGSQSSVKQSEIIEQKLAPIVLLLAKKKRKKLKKPAPIKEPEQTIDDELRARFAQRKAGSQSSVKQCETIEQKLARRKAEALLLAEKEPEQTFQGLRKKFDG